MKYLLNDYLFINGYKIQDDKIIVNYESGSVTYDYSKDLEILILEEMKRQVLNANNKINESEKRLKKNRFWLYYNIYFMAYNTYMSFHDSKALHITLASLFLTLNCFYASIINIDKERIK
jgi:hypothetical protein